MNSKCEVNTGLCSNLCWGIQGKITSNGVNMLANSVFHYTGWYNYKKLCMKHTCLAAGSGVQACTYSP